MCIREGGYDCQCPSLAIADVQDLGDVYVLGEHRVSRSQAWRSKPEHLRQPPLLILEGYALHATPRSFYLGPHLFVYYIIFLIFTK